MPRIVNTSSPYDGYANSVWKLISQEFLNKGFGEIERLGGRPPSVYNSVRKTEAMKLPGGILLMITVMGNNQAPYAKNSVESVVMNFIPGLSLQKNDSVPFGYKIVPDEDFIGENQNVVARKIASKSTSSKRRK